MEPEQKYSAWVNNVTLRRHRLVNESFSTRHGTPPYEFSVREASEIFKTTKAIAISLVYHHYVVRPYFGCRTLRNQSQKDWGMSSLLNSVQKYQKVLCRMLGGETHGGWEGVL